MNVSIYMCDMTPSYVLHNSRILATCLVHMYGVPHSFVTTTNFYMELTHSWAWLDLWLIEFVTWLVHMYVVPHSFVTTTNSYMELTHSWAWLHLLFIEFLPGASRGVLFLRVLWLGNIVNRKHPRGGRFATINLMLCLYGSTVIRVTWLIHMCDMTHSYVWHDSFICLTWLIHMSDMTYSHVNDPWKCVT